jgi:hypothetical protein
VGWPATIVVEDAGWVVIAGATFAGLTVSVNACVPFGETPLFAVIVI